MISLSIDTSAQFCAAALHDSAGGGVLAECTEDIGRGHAERLMDIIGVVLAEAKADYFDLDRVVAVKGPGSFTGVRIGLATARGIALGLGKEACGVSTLQISAFHALSRLPLAGDPPLLVALDARRGEAFCQIFGGGSAAGEPFVAAYHLIAPMLAERSGWRLCGSGASHVNTAGGSGHFVMHDLAAVPIASIARLGAMIDAGDHRPEPLYLRAPNARPQEGFTLRRA